MRLPAGQHDGAIDHVAKLADVAGPVVGEQFLAGFVGEFQTRPAVLAAEMIEEEIDQQRNIAATFAQRRDDQLEHAEAVVKIFTEFFLLHVALQILVGGGDHANIDFDLLRAADGHEGMAFENAEQLGLAFEGHLADFVEEQHAAVGLLEKADMVAIGAGEGAGFVAEELAFHQLVRDGGAVDAKHRSIGAGAGFMNARGRRALCRSRFRRAGGRSRWLWRRGRFCL